MGMCKWRIATGEHVEDMTLRDKVDALNVRKVAGIVVKDVRRSTGEVRSRVVVPQSLQLQVTQMAHLFTHAGVTGTYKVLQLGHWFRGMKRMVKRVVRSCCGECIAVKGSPPSPGSVGAGRKTGRSG